MVFESVVEDLIKKYLGDYVENFELEISITKGTVILRNLDLKENALDAFDLPVKIKAGHINKLTLLMQWTNLYTKPLAVILEGVYVLVVPNMAQKYNEEKEKKEKQKKLQRIEDAIKLDAERVQNTTSDNTKQSEKDSFSEKMATHIIKNLKVKVFNVHVRYEDKYTNPKCPFSIGLLIEKLLFKTTDEHWKKCAMKESVTQIFKLIKLDSLSVYWNINSELFDSENRTDVLYKLTNRMADREKDPGFQYLIAPISPEAKLRIYTKPEMNNFHIPKYFLTISLDAVSVVISKLQFNCLIEMIEYFERMKLISKNKERRPDVPLKNNAKQWWHYAKNSILCDIRRRRKMWSWSYIARHRINMKRYKDAYVKKLNVKKITDDLQEQIDEYESVLNVLSIILMRQLAEVEASKHKMTQVTETGWFGFKTKSNEMIEDMKNTFQEEFTADEKIKLYNAIGYEENHSDITLPKDFIAEKLEITFTKLILTLKDNESKDIITFQLEDVYSLLGHRPSANAMKVEAKVKTYTVQGTPQNGHVPVMVLSHTREAYDNNSLFGVWFETNPLEGACDTRVELKTRHIDFIYDAVTMNNLVKFSKPPDNVDLQQLSQTALATFEAMKEYSATGLRHAIDQSKYTEILVDIQPSFVIIPNNGYYTTQCRALIFDLGSLKVRTGKRQSKLKSQQEMKTVEELTKKAYDRFEITLDRVQILFSSSGEEWRERRKESKSHMHLLEPIEIEMVLQKCTLDKDLGLTKMKMSGELPMLRLNMSDQKLHALIELADSIPLPKSTHNPGGEIFLARSEENMEMNDRAIVETAIVAKSKFVGTKQPHYTNFTKMEIKFEIKKVEINISQVDNGKDVPVLRLVVSSLGTEVAFRTYDMDVAAYLGGLYLQHKMFMAPPEYTLRGTPPEVDGQVVNLVNTPGEDGSKILIQLHYIKTKMDGPTFATTYKKIEHKIDMSFASLQVLVHQEALLHVLESVENLKLASKNKKEVATITTEEVNKNIKKPTEVEEEIKKKTTRHYHLVSPRLSLRRT